MKDIEKALGRAQNERPTLKRSDRPKITPNAFAEAVPEMPPSTPPKRGEPTSLSADLSGFRSAFTANPKRAETVDGAFRILRTRVLDAVRERNLRVIGITSATPNAGKSVTAIQLAMACARREDQTVILADFDYRRPSIAKYLNASGFQRSTEFFRSRDPVEAYVATGEQENLKFLLNDEPTDMSAEYLASARMDTALSTLTRARDSVVIADLPPIVGCDDAIAMMPKLDGVILVVEAGKNSYTQIEQVASLIPEDKLIAAVLNRVPNADSKYTYSYATAS